MKVNTALRNTKIEIAKIFSILAFAFVFEIGLFGGLLEENLGKLTSTDVSERIRAARALASLADENTVLRLIDALKNEKDKRVKIALIESLKNIKSKKAIPLLLEKSKNEEEEVRVAAVEALGEIGDKKTIPELKKLLKDPSRRVRCWAAGALRKMGRNEGMEVLIDCLKKGQNLDAIKNSVHFRGEKKVAEALIPFLKSKDSTIRFYTAWALGEIKSKIAVLPLIEQLKKEETEGTRIKIIQALGEIGGGKEVAEALYPYLFNKNEMVAKQAVETISKVENEGGIKFLIDAFQDENVPKRIRALCIKTAWEKSKKMKKDVIYAILKDKNWAIRWTEKDAVFLKDFTKSDDEIVRARAYSGLARIDIAKNWQTIEKGLEDKSPIVRGEIILRIGDFAFKPGFDAVIKSLEDPELLEYALVAIEAIKDEKAIPYLEKLKKKTKDRELRKRIKQLIEEIKERRK